MLPGDDDVERIRAYHDRTKHQFQRYAASPGYLDWDTQPDPFRRWAGAPVVELPLLGSAFGPNYADLFRPGHVAPQPVTRETIGALLQLSLGLAAWKQYGPDRWALRCNPSSGNLHPTEAYLLTGGLDALADGVHHYQSHDHCLELRCAVDTAPEGWLIALSSIHWREAWKYGERAFRYCQHDAGHALGALRYAAAVLGWRIRLLDTWSDADIATACGIDRRDDFAGAELEHPDLICQVLTREEPSESIELAERWTTGVKAGIWHGTANRLGDKHRHDWPVIDAAAEATIKPRTEPADRLQTALPALVGPDGEVSAAEIIRTRRSAQGFDGVTAMPAATLYHLLDAVLPRHDIPPFDVWPWPPRLHLLCFVHRVTGLVPGLYVLSRDPEATERLRAAMKPEFLWERPEGTPEHLAWFHLLRANARQAAKTLSCHQDIAADSAFSLGMLGEFDSVLDEGAWGYRRLFWEAGLIGQSLYLEAEAAGFRGTGIGCYFDDPVHELIGVTDHRWQSIYHFTIGGPLTDSRLQTLPPYSHLSAR